LLGPLEGDLAEAVDDEEVLWVGEAGAVNEREMLFPESRPGREGLLDVEPLR